MTRALWTHLAKDLRIEWRSLDAMISMLFFSGLVVVLFSIAFDPRGAFSQQIAGGVLCVATMFASVSALNQAWAREIRHQVMDAQRMVPSPGAELYLAKAIANFLFVTIVQVILAPFFVIFYNLHIAGNAWLLVLVLPLGTWALVGNGIFFAALAMSSRNRELLLSLILFPIFIPALLAMVQATTAIFTGESDPTLWIKMLARLRHHLHDREPAAVRRRLSRRVACCAARGIARPHHPPLCHFSGRDFSQSSTIWFCNRARLQSAEHDAVLYQGATSVCAANS